MFFELQIGPTFRVRQILKAKKTVANVRRHQMKSIHNRGNIFGVHLDTTVEPVRQMRRVPALELRVAIRSQRNFFREVHQVTAFNSWWSPPRFEVVPRMLGKSTSKAGVLVPTRTCGGTRFPPLRACV